MQGKKLLLTLNMRTIGTCLIVGGVVLAIISILKFPPAGLSTLHYTTILALAVEFTGILVLSKHYVSTHKGRFYSRLFLAIGLFTLVVIYFIIFRIYLM